MRPNKRILLVTNDRSQEEQYTLILRTWRYAVLLAPTGSDLGEASLTVDAVLTVHVAMHEINRLASLLGPTPLVALVPRETDRQIAARMGATHTAADNYLLREQVRTAVARKRGPKPVQSAPAADMERAA